MRKQITLILPLMAAMISTLVFATVESASTQNASMNGNACMSCGGTTGTNMTNATMGDANATMTATSGSSAKTHLEDGIKALQSGDKEGAMTQLTAAQKAMSGSSHEAIKHFEEGMKALESGDSNGAIMYLQIADQSLG
jgi:hypothetical protein